MHLLSDYKYLNKKLTEVEGEIDESTKIWKLNATI